MTELSKTKSCPKPVPFKIYASFESNSESIKSNDRFYAKKYQSNYHTSNQQKCINCLKLRLNKNER